MKRRKLIASLLAMALSVGLAVPAFADDVTLGTADGQQTTGVVTITSDIKVPTIEVVIGTPTAIIINPYGMEVSVTSGTTHDTMITTPTLLTNNSSVNVEISAQPQAVVSQDITVQEDGGVIPEGTKNKTVSMTLYMAPQADGTDAAELTGSETGASNTPVKKSNPGTAKITLDATGGTNAYGSYQIKGYSAGTNWASGDKISTTISFSINPVFGTGEAT